MPIFLSDITMRDLHTRSGDLHTSQPRADEFTARLGSRMSMFGKEAQTKTMEMTKDFEGFNLRENNREAQELKALQAGAASEDALEAIAASKQGPKQITSLSQLTQTRAQKKQNLRKARQSLQRAKEMFQVTGSSFSYDPTGYVQKQTEGKAAEFGSIFDQAIEQRKQQYAELYGFENFESIQNEGYGMTDYSYTYAEDSFGNRLYHGQPQGVEYGTVGQRDIMDMIMSDMTGMDYGRLAELNTFNLQDHRVGRHGEYIVALGGSGQLMSYTEDQMEALKDFFVTSNVDAIKNANERARAEDDARRASFEAAKKGAVKSQISLQKASEEEIGKSLENVQLQLRELDDQFMKDLKVYKTKPRKRKAPGVVFDRGRPQ